MDAFANDRGPPWAVALPAPRMIEQVRDEAMFLIDLHGRIASWNEGVGLLLGWEKDDWIGQPLAVAFTEEDVAAGVHVREMEISVATGRADDDRWMRRKSGERFFALGMMTRLLDDDGQHVAYLKVLRDFTAAKAAERERERLLAAEGAARAEAESQAAALTAAFEAMVDGVLIGDAGGVRRCNAAAVELLGATDADALAADAATLVARFRFRREADGPPMDPAELPLMRAAAGETASMELWATRADDGRELFLRSSAAPVRVDGRVDGAVVVLTDLTERLQLRRTGNALHRMETALNERLAELRALTEGVRDYAIITIGTDARISSWHVGAMLMKGYTAEEAIGMPFADLFTPEDRARGRPEAELAIAAQQGNFKGDGQRMRKDGSLFDAEVVLTALRGPDGELLGYLKLTQDVTERKHREQEREATLREAESARAEAEQANRSKDDFLATISHELRTPLSAILGWAHVLERGVLDPDSVRHGLSAISRNARVQVQLIEDLLDMNRIESGQLRLEMQRTELGSVIAAAIDSALPAATLKHVMLRMELGSAVAAVMGDAARLQQVVGNLLSNAIKFTPEGGRVNVALSQFDGQARITVTDTGQGIAPGFVDRLFHRFQQQDATTTRRHGGLGIGLAIVRHLLHLHGGTVGAASPGVGRGATFTITLPTLESAPSPPAPARVAAPAAAEMRLDGVSVLLVDDEPEVRAISARVLQDAGAHVMAAADADEALALLQREHPAVLLSDIGMPDADGYELLRRVRALSPEAGGDTPAAAFTAYARAEDRQQAYAAGYQMHLAKPVPPATLVRAVAVLAAERRPHGATPPA